MGEKEKKGRAEGQINLLGTAGTMGMHMVSGPMVGFALGFLADKWLDSWPFGAGAGILLGLIAGFRNVWEDTRYLARANEENDRKKKREGERKSREEIPAASEKRDR
ncbi:MAG: AtpZ/AtpI family protein, partial [Mailhella sp.]